MNTILPLPMSTLIAFTILLAGCGTSSKPEHTESGDATAEVAHSTSQQETQEAKPNGPDLVAMFPQWEQAKSLKGDADAGRQFYLTKTYGNDMTCAACHSFHKDDTMTVDHDGIVRAGSPIFGAAHRTNIKKSGSGHAALGANVCVIHFMDGEKPGMETQELANMDAFLRTGGDENHATSQNINYAERGFPIPETLTGGDADRGQKIAATRCVSCHGVQSTEAKFVETGIDLGRGDYGKDDLADLALRIRNPNDDNNEDMPAIANLRLNDQGLLDVLAWLTAE